MKIHNEPTEAGRRYAAAYAAHYTERDLRLALRLYHEVVESYPNELEASYSRMQIQNVVNAVVPAQELLNLQTELAFTHLEHLEMPEAAPTPAPALTSRML